MPNAKPPLPDGCPKGVRTFIEKMKTEGPEQFHTRFDTAVETILELSAAHPWQTVACLQQLFPVAYAL